MADKKTRDLLRKNKHSPVLQLWLNKDSKNGATSMALEQNTTVHTVSIFVEEDFMEGSHEELMSLFDEIGRLPLTHLYVYSFGRNYDVFPIKLLLHIFDYAAHLQVLTMYFVELGGHERYFRTFEQVIKDHQQLKEFRLENCRLSDEILESVIFDKFVTTISALPKIQKIDLLATEMGTLGNLTPAALAKMGASETLKSLELLNFTFTNEHIAALSEVVNSNESLTELSISCDPKWCNNLAPMLATNKTLTTLKLRLEDLYDGVFLHQVALGLTENKTMTRFEIQGEDNNKMSKRSQKFFVDMLEKNQVIEHLDIKFSDEEYRNKVIFYLKLNQTGKRKVMQNPNSKPTDLINAVAYVGNDLDCLHHFLVTKPSMVQD